MRSADLIAAVLASQPDDWMPHPKSAIDSEPTDDCDWPSKVGREPVDGKPSYYAEALVQRADRRVMLGVGRLPPVPPPRNYTREPWALRGGLWFASASECEVHLLVGSEIVTRWEFVWLKEYRHLLPLPMADGNGEFWVAGANVRFAETLFQLVRPGHGPHGDVASVLRAARVQVRDTGRKGVC
jgi:hypothetical protein